MADFIGEANIVEVKVLDLNENRAQVQLGTLKISTPFLKKPDKDKIARLIIRPEDIYIGQADEKGLKGVVKYAMYQGATNDYIIDTEAGELRIIDYQAKGVLREHGTQVSLTFREDHIFLLN